MSLHSGLQNRPKVASKHFYDQSQKNQSYFYNMNVLQQLKIILMTK
jgi:hypothetical protein